MKKYLLIFLCLCTYAASAQFTVQSSGLTLVAGTSLNINNLVLTPSANLTLANQTITRSATPAHGSPGGASILQVHKFSTPINFSGTAAIKYSASELNGNTEASLQIAYCPVLAGGIFTTTTGSSTGAAGSYYVSKSGLAGITIGQITATNNGVILPVTLTAFKAETTADCHVVINWSAEATSATESFIVESSVNTTEWKSVGAGLFAASGSSAYSITDNKPDAGTMYYRLKITNAGGAITYSNISPVKIICLSKPVMTLSPNPVQDIATLKVLNGVLKNALITVYDASGKVVKAITFSGSIASLNLTGLSKGIYTVSCKADNISSSWKILLQ
jgi:hypothetical protein